MHVAMSLYNIASLGNVFVQFSPKVFFTLPVSPPAMVIQMICN